MSTTTVLPETATTKDFTALLEIIATLPESGKREVYGLWSQATGYVWGWQDAGASPKDSGTSYAFGLKYALAAARYAAGQTNVRHNIQDSFTAFREGRDVAHPYDK